MLSFVALLVLGILAGLFMATFIGANDIANAMGATLGCRALTLKKIIILAAIFELMGSILLGGYSNILKINTIDLLHKRYQAVYSSFLLRTLLNCKCVNLC
jgi:phosphate/sulfate permease